MPLLLLILLSAINSTHGWAFSPQVDILNTRDECTPLVFDEEGILKGIGYPYYQKILDQDNAQRQYVNELL